MTRPPATRPVVWRVFHPTDDAPTMMVGEAGSDLAIEWMGVARLLVRPDGLSHDWTPAPGVSAGALRKVQRGVGLAVIRHLQGRLSLHGSAVAVHGHALVFAGPSGAGKSSLAAGLCARRGAALLADDMVGIDESNGFDVIPTEDTHALNPESMAFLALSSTGPAWEGKDWARPSELGVAPAPLRRVFILNFHEGDGPVRVEPARGARVAMLLMPQVPRLPLAPRVAYEREIETLVRMASRGLVSMLHRPRKLDTFDETLDAVLASLAQST